MATKKIVLFALLSGLLISCDIDKYTTSYLGGNTAILDSTEFNGRILDKYSGDPVEGAKIWTLNYMAVSGPGGNYTLKIPFREDYNRNLSILLSTKAEKYSPASELLTPQPLTTNINFKLVYLPPTILSFRRESIFDGEFHATVFYVTVRDYQGFIDIASVYISYWVSTFSQNVENRFVKMERYDTDYPFTGYFKVKENQNDLDDMKSIFIYAYDFGGFSDTVHFAPRSY